MKVYMVRNGMNASGYTIEIYSRDCDADKNYTTVITHSRYTKHGSVQKTNAEVEAEAAEYIAAIEAEGYVKVDDIAVNKYNPRYKK